jgi:hypothetical protein
MSFKNQLSYIRTPILVVFMHILSMLGLMILFYILGEICDEHLHGLKSFQLTTNVHLLEHYQTHLSTTSIKKKIINVFD